MDDQSKSQSASSAIPNQTHPPSPGRGERERLVHELQAQAVQRPDPLHANLGVLTGDSELPTTGKLTVNGPLPRESAALLASSVCVPPTLRQIGVPLP